jgi:hypothetical protein
MSIALDPRFREDDVLGGIFIIDIISVQKLFAQGKRLFSSKEGSH